MQTTTQTLESRGLQAVGNRRRITHRRIITNTGVDALLATTDGHDFISSCLEAVTLCRWGTVSSAEAAANYLAANHGGHIGAAFVVPDNIAEEQVLLIDIVESGSRRSRTLLRLLDPAMGAAR